MRSFIAMCAAPWLGAHLYAAVPDNQNAATWYQKAIEQYLRLDQSQRDLLSNYEPVPGSAPPPEIRAALSSVQGILSNLQRGASQDYWDFNLDRNAGFAMLMPHLGQLRGIARIARTDALVRLHDGDSSGAAGRIASLYRLAGQTGQDRTVISSLVGQAVFALGDNITQAAVDAGTLTPADAAALSSAITDLGVDDPFKYVEAAFGEQEMTIITLEKIGDEMSPEDFAALIGQPDNPEILALTADDVDQAIGQFDQMMNRVVEIFAIEDPEKAKAAMQEWADDLGNGEYGALARITTTAYTKVLERKLLGEQMLATRLAELTKLAAAEVTASEAANAAVWYLRGIELMKAKVDEPTALGIRAIFADLAAPMDLKLAEALNGVKEVIDVFREGSLKRRCDFKFARDGVQDALLPSYAPGMHDALRLLAVDALRLLRGGDPTGAVDRLAIALRVVAHLGADPQIGSALVAHHDFNATLALAEEALRTGLLSEDAKPPLFDAADRISKKDPFCYIGAITEARAVMIDRLAGQYARDQEEIDRRNSAAETVKSFNGDHLLYLAVIFETMRRNSLPRDAQPGNASAGLDDLCRVSDILSSDQLETARAEVALIGPMIAQHDWDFFDGRTFPHIAAASGFTGVADGMRRARADLRRALSLLRPPVTDVPTVEPSIAAESP